MRILEHLTTIVKTINNNPVTILVAPTGTGKSTIVPGVLARINKSRESGHAKPAEPAKTRRKIYNKKKRVFVSVPTRTSARSLRMYVQKVFPTIEVGSAAEGNIEYSSQTDLIYVTSGHARKKMFNAVSSKNKSIDFADILIVDESHTGSVDNTIIISIWMYAHAKGYRVPKLVLVSATPTPMIISPLPAVYTVPVPQSYPVEIIYNGPGDGKVTNVPREKEILDHAFKIMSDILEDTKHTGTKHTGDVLIFVAGSGDVEALIQKFNTKNIRDKAVVIGAYSAMKKEDMDLIYDDPPEGKCKIIVATNIAESSITIEGLTIVIDTLLEKRSGSTKSGGKRLSTEFIAKDSAEQRKGRIGRTKPGKCYRLLSKAQYENLDNHKLPEIERVPIHEVVIELMVSDLNPIDVIKGIDVEKVRSSIDLLRSLGMVNRNTVTDMGKFSTYVPLSVNNSSLLYRWIESGAPLFPGIVISSIIDCFGPSYFYIPRKEKDQNAAEYRSYISTYAFECSEPHIGQTELHTYINLWSDFTLEVGKKLINIVESGRVPKDLISITKEWANLNKINWKKFSELLSNISQTYNGSKRFIQSYSIKTNDTIGRFETENAMNRMYPLILKSYPRSVVTKRSGSNYQNPLTGELYSYDTRTPFSLMDRTTDLPSKLLTLNSFQLSFQSGQIKNIISLAIDVPVTEEPEDQEGREDQEEPVQNRESGNTRRNNSKTYDARAGSSRSTSRPTRPRSVGKTSRSSPSNRSYK